MKTPKLSLLLFIAMPLLGVMGGCATYQEVSYYEPPAAASNMQMATLVGSRVKTTWPLDDETTWLLSIDGQPVKGRKDAFATAVSIPPGARTIQVALTQGSFFGQIAFKIDVKPGAQLVAKSIMQDKQFAAMWIEDQHSGQLVSDKSIVGIRAPQATFIPVFIGR